MRTHAHGQGYTDLNILIPELVDSAEYHKGPYFAEYGDFANAGAFDIHYLDNFARGLATIDAGQCGYMRGVIANFYTPTPWLTLDADFAFSNTRFRELAPEGQRVPDSVSAVIAAGASLHDLPGMWSPWSAALRLRYFSPSDLIENGAARSDSTTLVNAQLGYKFNETWSAAVDIFNLFDARDNDIDYFYTSRLRGEPAEGVDDFHSHPVEPRGVRASVTARF